MCRQSSLIQNLAISVYVFVMIFNLQRFEFLCRFILVSMGNENLKVRFFILLMSYLDLYLCLAFLFMTISPLHMRLVSCFAIKKNN